MSDVLRVVIADDERPARHFLAAVLRSCPDAELVGEAADGTEAIALIDRLHPDLALLDLEMPEIDGLTAASALDRAHAPLVAFVTAHESYAVRAFAVDALDYLLKPVTRARLETTLQRARERLAAGDPHLGDLPLAPEAIAPGRYLERIPVRHRQEIYLIPVADVVSVIAEGELLHLTTVAGARYVLSYRLKDLEARFQPGRFVRLSRGSLVNVAAIARVSSMPGGTFVVVTTDNRQLPVSRIQSRLLRDELLRL